MVQFPSAAVAAAAAAAVLVTAPFTEGAPTQGSSVKTLFARANTFEDCDEGQRTKAGQALADAATLARWTFDEKFGDQSYQATDAYKHYFEDSDSSNVTMMLDLIQQNNDPTNAPYNFILTCKNDPICDGGSLAVTDAVPKTDSFTPHIRLCPKFFDSATPQTKNDLGSKDIIQNPKRGQNSWCQPGQTFPFFEVAGTTILHEMTHLDAVGAAAGLSNRDIDQSDPSKGQSHGTEDVYDLNDPNYKYNNLDPYAAARKLKNNWANKKNGKDPILQRVENAESYAASATEFYFQQQCNFDTILP